MTLALRSPIPNSLGVSITWMTCKTKSGMFFTSFFVSFSLVVISGTRTILAIRAPGAPVTLAFRTQINATRVGRIPDVDRARAAAFVSNARSRESGKRGPISTINTAVSYTASIGVGSPATYYTLLIDTGSANTWIGADKQYIRTFTSINTGNLVLVDNGLQGFIGTEYNDMVTVSINQPISNQSIGVASYSWGFHDVDGVLGLGPVDLTLGTVFGKETVPTVTDNLRSQGNIANEIIGIYFQPALTGNDTGGEVSIGGYDWKYIGSLTTVSITSTFPANQYWGLDQSISYGDETILSNTAGIVDSGTTLVLIATDAFEQYIFKTGAIYDYNTGFFTITPEQYSTLSNLNFVIGGTTFSLTPNAQIWPRALNGIIGGSNDRIYLIVADIGWKSGSGLDFINGYTFLERFYSVYEVGGGSVSFGITDQTYSTSN